MAEFGEVMRQWGRMCSSMTNCDYCPVYDSARSACIAKLKNLANREIRAAEEEVMGWAAVHPEPAYPTWREWLEEMGVIDHAENYAQCGVTVARKRIPYDIARKLGITPIVAKEARHDECAEDG